MSLVWLGVLYSTDHNDTLIQAARVDNEVAGSLKSYFCLMAILIPFTVNQALKSLGKTWNAGHMLNCFSIIVFLPIFAFTDVSWMLAVVAANIYILLVQFKAQPLFLLLALAFIIICGIYEHKREKTDVYNGLVDEIVLVFVIHAATLEIIWR